MRRSGWLVAAGGAAFLVFLVAFLPASAMLRVLPAGLTLEGPEGTVWRGRVADARWNGKSLGPFRWSCRVWRLASLRLDYAVEYGTAPATVRLDVALRPGGRVDVSGVRGSVPISRFAGLVGPRGWNGTVELEVERLALRDGKPTAAEGWVRIRALSAPYAQSSLGDFELLLGEGSVGREGVAGRLRDLGQGPLTVRATLFLDPTGEYLMSGEVATAPDAEPRLQQALAYLGPPDSLGRRSFSIEGRL